MTLPNKELAASKTDSTPPAMCGCWNIDKFKTLLIYQKYSICALAENWLNQKCRKFLKHIFSHNTSSHNIILNRSPVSKQPRKTAITIFPSITQMVIFGCSRAGDYVACSPIWLKFENIQDIIQFLLTCKFKKDRINSNREPE